MALDPAVRDLLIAWGNAGDGDVAAQKLKAGAASFSPEQRAALINKLAELNAEVMVELLAMADRIEPIEPEEIIDVEGVPLHPLQVERLSAWAHNQKKIADALRLDQKTWANHLGQGMDRYRALLAGETSQEAPEDVERSLAKATKLLGATKESFENRPKPGASPKAGLSGLLAARSFKK